MASIEPGGEASAQGAGPAGSAADPGWRAGLGAFGSGLWTAVRPWRWRSTAATSLESAKTAIELLAFAAGGVYVVLQLLSGSLNQGLELSVNLSRGCAGESDASKDAAVLQDLVILIGLKRTNTGRIQLEDMHVKVTEFDSAASAGSDAPKVTTIPARDIERQIQDRKTVIPGVGQAGSVTDQTHTREEHKDSLWDRRGYAMPPGDATQFAYFVPVAAKRIARVEVVVLGERTLWPDTLGGTYPQWQASAVSPPQQPAEFCGRAQRAASTAQDGQPSKAEVLKREDAAALTKE